MASNFLHNSLSFHPNQFQSIVQVLIGKELSHPELEDHWATDTSDSSRNSNRIITRLSLQHSFTTSSFHTQLSINDTLQLSLVIPRHREFMCSSNQPQSERSLETVTPEHCRYRTLH